MKINFTTFHLLKFLKEQYYILWKLLVRKCTNAWSHELLFYHRHLVLILILKNDRPLPRISQTLPPLTLQQRHCHFFIFYHLRMKQATKASTNYQHSAFFFLHCRHRQNSATTKQSPSPKQQTLHPATTMQSPSPWTTITNPPLQTTITLLLQKTTLQPTTNKWQWKKSRKYKIRKIKRK